MCVHTKRKQKTGRVSKIETYSPTRVWQNQNSGTGDMLAALYARNFGGGYGYETDIIVEPPEHLKLWRMLNPEQQGQIIQDAYDSEYFTDGNWHIPNTIPPQ
ncbi:MAG: hypothetical protein M3T96_11580 [Acidobacteriota bacterium]|nr:hypothetical protein [Acidobacteriota bacterium]